MGVATKAQRSTKHSTLGRTYSVYFVQHHRTLDIFQSALIIILGQGFQITRVLDTAFCRSGTATAGVLAAFPCGATENQQMLWIFKRAPWLSWHLGSHYYWLELTWTIAVELVILVGATTQARWYRHGGRSLLYAAMRPGIVVLIFLQLLLAPVNPVLLATAEVCYLGSKGLLFLIFGVLCQGFPWRAHVLVTLWNWAFLTLYNLTYHWKFGGAAWDSVAVAAAIHLLVGVGFPLLASRLRHKSVFAKYQASQSRALELSDAKVTREVVASAASPQPNVEAGPPPPRAPAAAPPAPAEHEAPAAVAAAGPAYSGGAPGSYQAAPTDTAPCGTGDAGAGFKAADVEVDGKLLRKTLYRGISRVRLVNIKIQHHQAYEMREAIAAAVAARLQALCTPRGEAAAPPMIRTLAIPGCLQLIMSVTQPGPPGDPTAHPAPPPPLERLAGGPVARDIYEALPADCRDADVTIQVGTTACHFGTAGEGGGDAPGGRLQHVEVAALRLEPACVSAGLAQPQDVKVRVPPGVLPPGGAKLLALVSVGGRQHHVVVEVAEAAAAAGACCLTLPPNLDAGPIAIHAIAPLLPMPLAPTASRPAPPLVVATASTLSLPAPAAAELSDLYTACSPDPELDAELAAIIADLAAVWLLAPAGSQLALDVSGDILSYLSANGLHACITALSQRLLLAPQAPPSALAALRSAPPAQDRSRKGASPPRRRWPLRSYEISTVMFVAVCYTGYYTMQRRGFCISPSALPLVAHMTLVIAPNLLADRLRLPRAGRHLLVAAAQVAKMALYVLALWWPVLFADWTAGHYVLHSVLIEGMMKPCILQVPWALQLFISAGEELSMWVSCSGIHATGYSACTPISAPLAVAVALTACLTSLLVERVNRWISRPRQLRHAKAE